MKTEKVVKTVWTILGVMYLVTIYPIGWILWRIARVALALSYILMLEKRKGIDILKSLF